MIRKYKNSMYYLLNERIMHYRIPVFDRLNNLIKNERFRVIGELPRGEFKVLQNDRDYIINKKKLFIVSVYFQAFIQCLIDKPKFLIVGINNRNLIILFFMIFFKRNSTIYIGWSKIASSRKYKGITLFFYIIYCKILYSQFDHLFVYGHESKKILNRLGIYSNITIVQNAISVPTHVELNFLEKSFKSKYNLQSNKRIILIIGRMDEDKRPMDILDVWPEIADRFSDVELHFAGSGPLLKKIIKLTKVKQFNRIKIFGKVPLHVDSLLIRNSFICLQQGAVGLAINQAMSLKTLNIIADEEGPDSELVVNRITGIRYKKGDLYDLKENICWAFCNIEKCNQIVHNAYTKIDTEVSTDKMAEKMFNIFKDYSHSI